MVRTFYPMSLKRTDQRVDLGFCYTVHANGHTLQAHAVAVSRTVNLRALLTA